MEIGEAATRMLASEDEMCFSPSPISVSGTPMWIAPRRATSGARRPEPSQRPAPQGEREQHERGEPAADRGDLGRGERAQADLDEEVGGAPEGGEEDQQDQGAAVHDALAARSRSAEYAWLVSASTPSIASVAGAR